MVLLRLFPTGILIILLLCPLASCSARPTPPNNDNYYCNWCPRHSTASPDDLDALLRSTDGGVVSCGYPAADLLDADGAAPYFVAAAGADFFFRDGGAGCGACYQLRCRDRSVCGDGGGVKVVVVAGAANRTGFLLTREAFSAMAKRPGMSSDDQLLLSLGGNAAAVQVDFRRIPCEYKNKNLWVLINEGSSSNTYLDMSFLYQGGQTDIAAVEIAQLPSSSSPSPSPSGSTWQAMERVRRHRGGAVTWRTSRGAPPAGRPLQLRLVVTAGVGGKWLRAAGDGEEHGAAVIPADWRPGQVHDTGIRVRDVALGTCARSCRRARRRPAVMVAGGGGEELR